jgi:hypothetical protein
MPGQDRCHEASDANKFATAGSLKERRGDERVQDAFTVFSIEPPQAHGLSFVQAQSGHLEEFVSDADDE